MSRRCFFAEGIQPGTEFVELSPEESHHLDKVLRLKTGEAIELRDGIGNAWAGEVARTGKKSVSVLVLERLDRSDREPALGITLALGLARSDTMDLVIRQATEMGVSRLAVFRAARSQYGLAGKSAGKRIERWLKISREAVCQCGRTRMPQISVFENLDHFIDSSACGIEENGVIRILASEVESEKGLDLLRENHINCKNVIAAIGPEGGWEDHEIQKFIDARYQPVHLGPRILRFETAAVALTSLVQFLWGDLGETGRKENNRNEMR